MRPIRTMVDVQVFCFNEGKKKDSKKNSKIEKIIAM
jgi:hypothetical protein